MEKLNKFINFAKKVEVGIKVIGAAGLLVMVIKDGGTDNE